MKLRFKFMNYFMQWLRTPGAMRKEDQQLLECLNNVLSMEQKKLCFTAVDDLPKPRAVENHSRSYSYSSQRYNNENNGYKHTNGSNRNDFYGNSSNHVYPENQTTIQKKAEPSKNEFLAGRPKIVKSNPMFRLAAETTRAAATTSDGINYSATNELKNLVRGMQQSLPNVTETKKQVNVVLPVSSASDTSSTTISSSVNIQKAETVIVPSARTQNQNNGGPHAAQPATVSLLDFES